MKIRNLLLAIVFLLTATTLMAQEDVLVIEGGAANGGSLETTINGDTTETGERANPDRIYELKANEFYIQHAPINVNNPDGTITIRGQEGGKKPVIIRQEIDEVSIGANQINSSLTMQNVHYQTKTMVSNHLPWQAWNIKGDNHHLLVEDCLVEFCNGIIWNLNNVKQGAEIEIRNSYFRDFHDFRQWWGSRVVQCKVPVDTFIFENNTVTGGGLTVLGQECLFDYAVINHNTFINNHKYPFLNQYWKEVYFTNNLFVNANMVGEDHENVATGGQDPDALLHGISGVDTIEIGIALQDRFLVFGEDTVLSEEVDGLDDIIYYAADNVLTYSATLDDYYNGNWNDVYEDAPVSYLDWGGSPGPFRVVNVPGIWANSRTQDLIADWDNIKEENNHIYTFMAEDLGLGTEPLPQAAADTFIVWNKVQWGDTTYTSPTDKAIYAFGDFDPNTVPGVETEDAAAGEGGITRISDMIEDFSYTKDLTSVSDGLPIGALHWDDIEFDAEASLAAVKNAYQGIYIGVDDIQAAAQAELMNYPNPFSYSTIISYNLPGDTHVNLSVYDISGKLVNTLVNDRRAAGRHTVRFTPDHASSNTYFYRLTTDASTVTRKMLFLK